VVAHLGPRLHRFSHKCLALAEIKAHVGRRRELAHCLSGCTINITADEKLRLPFLTTSDAILRRTYRTRGGFCVGWMDGEFGEIGDSVQS